MKIFYEDDLLKISYVDDFITDRCLIVFTGVGHKLGGIDVQKEEFYSQHKFGMIIWITDKNRSWGNNLNVKKISEKLIILSKNKNIYIIGNSMGGFLAILFSKFLNAKNVIAFNPQFSVCPETVPNEKRWMNYRKFINKYRFKDLSSKFGKNIHYAILFGDDSEDDLHFNKFLEFTFESKIELIRLKNLNHNVAYYLKEIKLLNDVIIEFFNNRSLKNYFLKNSIEILEK